MSDHYATLGAGIRAARAAEPFPMSHQEWVRRCAANRCALMLALRSMLDYDTPHARSRAKAALDEYAAIADALRRRVEVA